MKKIFTILLFNLLGAGALFAQPVSLGSLQGDETYFTGFNGKVYFASGSDILVADPDMGNIASLLTLSQPVVTDHGYAKRFIRNIDGFWAPRFPVAGAYIYFMTKPSPDSITLWRNHKDSDIAEEIGVFDTLYTSVDFQGTLFFTAQKKDHGFQVWKVDDDGSVFPISDRPIGDGSLSYSASHMSAGLDSLYFAYENPTTGLFELYQSDGTAEETVLIHTSASIILYPTELLGKLYFATGGALWKYHHSQSERIVEPPLGMYGPNFVTKVNKYLIYGIEHEMDTYTKFYSMENGEGEGEYLNLTAYYYTYTHTEDKLILVDHDDHGYPITFDKTNGTLEGTGQFMSVGDLNIAHHLIAVKGFLFYGMTEDWSNPYIVYHLTQSDLNDQGVKVSDLFGGVEEYLMPNNFASSNDILFFTTADTVESPLISEPRELFYYHPSDIVTATAKSKSAEWSIYPNPASDHCVIKADANGTLQLMNAAGRVVLEVAFDRVSVLDISDLQSGIYFARLITGDKVSSVQKIVRK